MGIMQSMTITQAYIIIGTMYFLILAVGVYVIWWYNRNDITVSISEWKEGVLFNTPIRCRFSKERNIRKWVFWGAETNKPARLYKLFDFFSRKPLDIEYSGLKDQIIATESMPIIGVKRTLKLRRVDDGGLFAWQPPGIFTVDGLIKPNRMIPLNPKGIRNRVKRPADHLKIPKLRMQNQLPARRLKSSLLSPQLSDWPVRWESSCHPTG